LRELSTIIGLGFEGKLLWITGKSCSAIYNVKLSVERAFSSVSRK
jgi:hypothetical protein